MPQQVSSLIFQRIHLFLLSFTCFVLASASRASPTPEAAVESYLELLLGNRLKLEETAISPFCAEPNKAEIEQRANKLKALIADHAEFPNEKSPAYQLLETLKDDDLAVGIIAYRNADRPFQVQIQSFPVIKKGDTWLVAPMPGSFQHSLIGFDEERKARSQKLIEKTDERSAVLAEQETAKVLSKVTKKIETAKSKLPGEESSLFDRLLSLRAALRAGDLFLAMCHLPEGHKLQEQGLPSEAFTKSFTYLADSIAPGSKTPLAKYFVAPACAVASGPADKRKNDAELTVFFRSYREAYRFKQDFTFVKVDGVWTFRIPSSLEEGGDRNSWMMEREQEEMTEEWGASALEVALLGRHQVPDFRSPKDLANHCSKLIGTLDFENLLLLCDRGGSIGLKEQLAQPYDSAALSLLADLTSKESLSKKTNLAQQADRLARVMRSSDLKPSQEIISVRLIESESLAKWYWVNIDPGLEKAPPVQQLNFVKHGENWFIDSSGQREEFAELQLSPDEIQDEADQLISKKIADMANFIDPNSLQQGTLEGLEASWQELTKALENEPLNNQYEKCGLLAGSLGENREEALADMANVLRDIKFSQKRFARREISLAGPLGIISLSITNEQRGPRSPFYLFAYHEGTWVLLPQFQLEPAKNIGRKMLNKRVWKQLEKEFSPALVSQIRKSYAAHVERLPVE